MEVSYQDAPYSVRPEFADSHSRYWARLASPGAWFSSADRIAIANEVRAAQTCPYCKERKAALSPRTVKGEHKSVSALPPQVIEAVHSITTDPARLTRGWYEQLLSDGLTEGEYIEIVGTVVAMVSIDSFANAIGVSLRELPEAGPGEPTRYRPATASVSDSAWVPMVDIENAGTPEEDLWVSGKTGNVVRAMSLVPDEVRTLCELSDAHYLAMPLVRKPGVDAGRSLNRSQMELVAGRVSALNECFY